MEAENSKGLTEPARMARWSNPIAEEGVREGQPAVGNAVHLRMIVCHRQSAGFEALGWGSR